MNDFGCDKTSSGTSSLSRPVRILVIDDSVTDVELMMSIIRRKGLSVIFDHVDSPEIFQERLVHNDYDVILSDHNLQSWVAMDALDILRQSSKDIPFIVVTGTLGDERAVEYLKQGASDYVLKDNLERLPSVISRALDEKAQRDENTRLQKEILDTKEEWERTFDAISDSIMLLDRECVVLRANRATAELLGVDFTTLVGKHCFTIAHKDSRRPLDCPFRRMLLSGREEESEITDMQLEKILRVSTIPVRDRAGNIEGAIHVMRDITERKRLERELLQAQKLEAIGRLAGGVAHDFNNILGVIMGYSELMRERIPEEQTTLRGELTEIRKAGERAAGITRQLLAFSRKQVMQLKVLRLNNVVTDLAKVLRTLIGENIELVIKAANDLGMVRADCVQIQQVLMNLAINARDAMPNGGRLTIATSNVVLDEHYPRLHDPVAPGPYVMVSVTDTGVGMDAETVVHIFEPFFTTKEKEKGTGFGLSIVYGIVKQSGGYVWVYSEPGMGSTFKIYLPRVTEEAKEIPKIAPSAIANHAAATVLLVEDEGALADLVRTVLEQSGYVVLHADRGEDALQVASSYEGEIHLMLTDVILRGTMDGIELSQKLRSVRPQTRVLFMSGYSDALNRADPQAGLTLLEKPFTNDDLRQKVREALEGNGERPKPSSTGTFPVREARP
jgi:PAS domain S-box-containing protein